MKHFVRISCSLLVASLLLVAGCGGEALSGPANAEISGIVTDLNGNGVPNAQVSADGRTTMTNTAGAYVVTGVHEGVWEVAAQSSPNDGVAATAKSNVQVYQNERSRNVNLTLVPTNQQASIHGVVRDRFGNVLQGAHVFAFITTGGVSLSSVHDVTNGLGEYQLSTLAAGKTYLVNGSAREYASDRGSVVLFTGESRQYDIVVGDAFDPLLSPPSNLSAIAWTTPSEATTTRSNWAAYENLKRLSDPTRAARVGHRDETSSGNHVEVDVFWDFPTANNSYLLGYGIYMATSAVGFSNAVDYLRDPETNFYSDLSDYLVENTNYYYEATALNVNYPGTANSESDFSDRYGVHTLDDLFLDAVTHGPLTFHWLAGSGASEYFVYLFDEYPTIGTAAVWTSTSTSGLSIVYNGPSLVSGHRYYYMVLGLANGGDSRTLSRLGEFVAN